MYRAENIGPLVESKREREKEEGRGPVSAAAAAAAAARARGYLLLVHGQSAAVSPDKISALHEIRPGNKGGRSSRSVDA